MKRPVGDGMSIEDLRMGDIFHVKLRIAGEGLDFAIVNENKDRNLKEWVLDWLDNGTWDSTTDY